MPRAGRKPTPAEVRRDAGEPGRPLPVVVGGRYAPPVPPDLSEDQRECWDYIVTDLVAADAIDHADAGVIEAAAVFWGRSREARRELNAALASKRRPSLLIATPQGTVPNRLLDIERQSWREFRALAESLPLSPWGRARLGLRGRPTSGSEVDREIGLPPRLKAVGGSE